MVRRSIIPVNFIALSPIHRSFPKRTQFSVHSPPLMSMRVVASLALTAPGRTALRQQAGGNDAPRLHSEPWTSLGLHT